MSCRKGWPLLHRWSANPPKTKPKAQVEFTRRFLDYLLVLRFGENILPPGTNIPKTYANGSTEEQAFIQNLALFFTSFYKVCLDYWNALVSELFEAHHSSDNSAATANVMGLQMILEAMNETMERTKCCWPTIAKSIREKYMDTLPHDFKKNLSKEFRDLVEKGVLLRTKNSFKFSHGFYKVATKPRVEISEETSAIPSNNIGNYELGLESI